MGAHKGLAFAVLFLLGMTSYHNVLFGQSCYTSAGRFYDDCNDSSAFYPPKQARFVQVGSKSLMVINSNFQVRIFDMANPALPTSVATLVMPFPPGCGLPFGCGDNHFMYESTVKKVAVASLGNVGYAFAPLSGYGWDLLKLTVSGNTVNASWFNTGYHPEGNGGPYGNGALFTHGGELYLVGQRLDQASVASGDVSIRIYNLGANPPTDLFGSMGQGVRVPVGGANDPPPYNGAQLLMGYPRFWVTQIGAKRFLLVHGWTNSTASWFAAFDISDPQNPVGAAFITTTQDSMLTLNRFSNLEEGAPRLWVPDFQAGSQNSQVTLHRYDLAETNGQLSLSKQTFGPFQAPYTPGGGGSVEMGAGYGLLVVGWMKVGKAFALSPTGNPTELPDAPGYTDLSINLQEPCQYWDLGRGYAGLAVYLGNNGSVYFYRSAIKEGRMIQVAASCLSLTPTAQFLVANTSPEEEAAANCGPADAHGFPGDAFKFEDKSVGNLTYKSYVIKNSQNNTVFSSTWTAQDGWNPPEWEIKPEWGSKPETTGSFVATMTVGNGVDPDSSLTKTISLCPNPQANVTVTPAATTYLQNTQVTLETTGSRGHPSSYEFYLWQPGQTTPSVVPDNGNDGRESLTLGSCGVYQVAVVAHYPHSSTDSGCGSWYADNPSTYDACSGPITLTVSAAQGRVKVSQNGVETDSPLTGQPTTVAFDGQVAGGYTVGYTWSATVNNQTVTLPGLSDCRSASCTIPANTLTPNQAVTFTLQLQLTPDPGPCAPGPLSKTVTPTTASANFEIRNGSGQPITQAAVGQTVRLEVTSNQNVTLNDLKFRVQGNQSCDNVTEFPIICLGVCMPYRDVTFANEGSATVQLVWETQTGEQVLASKSLTLTPGNCPSNCTYSVSPTTASIAASGGSSSFTVSTQSGCSWQAVPDVSWVQVTSGSSGTGPGTVSYTVTANTGGSRQGKIRVPDGSSTVIHTILQSGSSGGGGGGGGGGGSTLTITPSPSQVSSFPVTVTFTFTPPLSQTGDTLTFSFGDGQQQTVSRPSGVGVNISTVDHVYQGPPTSGSVFNVSASGTLGGKRYSGSTHVTVACNAATAPQADFTWQPPQARAGQPIQFTDTSSGQPTSWNWDFGLPLVGGTSTQKNPTFTYPGEGTFTVTLTVANCKGTSQKVKQITVAPACGESEVPVADFTIQPVEPDPSAGTVCQLFPNQCQKQPYAGQQVKLKDASSHNPTNWSWYDFQELHQSFEGQASVTVAWPQPGDKNVRLKAQNCIGWSQEKLKVVKVYPDERPVRADFTVEGSLQVNQQVSLVAKNGFVYGNPTEFTWVIDDPAPGAENPVVLSGQNVPYTFHCGGSRKVILTVKRGSFQSVIEKTLELQGSPCGPVALISADVAKVAGLNNTFWRTDLRLFNPWEELITVNIDVLPPGQSNSNPPGVHNLPIAPKATLVLDNFLDFFNRQGGEDYQKAALRVRFAPPGKSPVMVGRTYTNTTEGGTYGQFIPALPVPLTNSGAGEWLAGLREDERYRTNVSLYNLNQDDEARLTLELYDENGQLRATRPQSIAPLGYMQAPLLRLFNVSGTLSSASMRLRPAKGEVGGNVSVVDNLTGDASLFHNEAGPTGTTVVIPGIARLPGEAGTNWRSSLAITNPEAEPHTWHLTLKWKAEDRLREAGSFLTLQPYEGLFLEDVVAWIFAPDPPPDSLKGTLVIEPDAEKLPTVRARTYNLGADGGTYGQSLKAYHEGNSAGGSSSYRKLFLTGLSSEDVARTNLGFVHVAGPTVNFKVWFYDETGVLLNPGGQPYTVALSAQNPWDQDKLENRFRQKGWTLPANLRAVSVVIEVEGGMGQAYASVIDKLTGDPVFISATPSP